MNASVQGQGPAILLVHGIPTGRQLWHFVAQSLQDEFSCIGVDLPGMGESPPLQEGSQDPARCAQALDELRVQLGLQSWHIVAHDAGAAVAVHYATRFNAAVNRLVLCSPPLLADFKIPWFFRLVRASVAGDLLAPIVKTLVFRVGVRIRITRRDDAVGPIIASFQRPFTGPSGTRRFVQMLRWGDPADVLGRTQALLPFITVPTLVIHGVKDRAIPIDHADRVAALIPRARLQLLDCGHFLPLNCPDALTALVRTFLSSDHPLAEQSQGGT